MDNKRFMGHSAAIFCIIVWGTTFISTKILLRSFSPIEILFIRFTIGYAALWLALPSRLRLTARKHELYFAAAGLCGVTLYFLLENIALTFTLVSNVGVIVSLSPFFAAIIACLFLRGERPGIRFVLGFVIAMTGIYLISFQGGAEVNFNPLGDLLAAGAAVIWAVYSAITKKISFFGYHTILVTRRIFFYGLVFMLPALFIMGFEVKIQDLLTPINFFNLLFLGLGASALCFATWNFAVKLLGPVKTTVYIYLIPVITTVTSVLVLHELISEIAIFGMLLTIIGLFLSEGKNFTRNRKKDKKNFKQDYATMEFSSSSNDGKQLNETWNGRSVVMKKLVVLLLSGLMVVSSLPLNVFAATAAKENASAIAGIATDKPAKGAKEPTQAGLTTAINIVKSIITIPSEYSEFNYYFNDASAYSDASWNLSWSTRDGKSSIQVNCDDDYHISYYNIYNYERTGNGIAKYLRSELQSTAESFVYKVVPEANGKLEFISSEFEGIYSNNYVYYYQRLENGISMPDNTVRVTVNSITGEVTSLSVNWLHGAKISTEKAKLTKEEATKLIKKQMKMKLVYRRDYIGIYDASNGTAYKKAFLVYEPTLPYISIDANTGKIYLTKSEWVNDLYDGKFKESAAEDSAKAVVGGNNELTPEEQDKVEELKNIISKEKAISIVTGNKALYLDKNLVQYNANLSKLDSSYVWNISLNDPREVNYEKDTDTYRGYAYATVDAVSGKVLSFFASMKDNYDQKNQKWNTVKIKYDKKAAKKILEQFIKEQMADRFKNSVFSEETEDYVVYYKNNKPVYGGYRYQYNRTNEGIEYPYNNINGSVDGVTGKIYSFGSYWEKNVEFESPAGVISADKAMDYYLAKDGYGLKYEINQINKVDQNNTKAGYYSNSPKIEYEVRLVYRPDVSPSYISPFNGEQLDDSGKVYKKAAAYAYEDITDQAKYKSVLLLADMNIGFEGGKFLPEQPITIGELNSILNKIGYAVYHDTADKAAEDASLITREEISQLFIDKLGLTKMAALSGIYKTGFYDENSINTKYFGAVALAKGLGIVKGDTTNKFNPTLKVTRADAIDMIIGYIKTQKDGVN